MAANSTIFATTLTADSPDSGQVQAVKLGSGTNELNVNTINLGGNGRSSATMDFNGLSGTVKIRALDGAGKRAAFALYYGPIHFELIRAITERLTGNPSASAPGATADKKGLPPPIHTLTPGLVIDLGCGDGSVGAVLLARFPGRKLTGVDTSPAMLADAGKTGDYDRWIAGMRKFRRSLGK